MVQKIINLKRNAWIVVLIAFFAGISLALAQNKVVPSIVFLMEDLDISMATAGWLSSIFCLMGMITAIPAAFILNRFGPKVSGLIALGSTIFGSFIGVLTSSIAVLFLSRIIEGFGVGLISVIGPALIAMWFPAAKRGLPMGIWGSWQMVAQAIIFFVGGHITVSYGWHGVWWFVISVCAVVAILYFWRIINPPAEHNYADVESGSISLKDLFTARSTWLISAAGLLFCFSCFGFATWIAAYWSAEFKWDINQANQWVSRLYFMEIFMVVFMGWFLDRIGRKRKMFNVVSYIFYTIILYLCFRLKNPAFIIPFVVIYALLEGAIPTALWTLTPQTVKDPSKVGLALGILCVGMNLGTILGPPMVGFAVENYGWEAGTLVLAASSILGMIVMARTKVYMPSELEKKRIANEGSIAA